MTAPQRISYVPLDQMTPEMRKEMDRCAREGTPRPESSAVRAHVPAAFWFFAQAWNDLFREGILDHSLKELCRVYVSRSVKCEYCGNQRSEKGRQGGLYEGKYDELLNFESSDSYSDREKAALAYAEFAAMTPVAGSAYTYAYTTLGEIVAWIIGWDLILEYAVGAATSIFTGRHAGRAGMRMALIGSVVAAVTIGIGSLVGKAV